MLFVLWGLHTCCPSIAKCVRAVVDRLAAALLWWATKALPFACSAAGPRPAQHASVFRSAGMWPRPRVMTATVPQAQMWRLVQSVISLCNSLRFLAFRQPSSARPAAGRTTNGCRILGGAEDAADSISRSSRGLRMSKPPIVLSNSRVSVRREVPALPGTSQRSTYLRAGLPLVR
jgi:hypothetical protein